MAESVTEEEQIRNIAWQQMFRYTIFWDKGVKDIIENNDIPLSWNIMDMGEKAIICPADPLGIPLSRKRNEEQAKKMAGFLRKRGLRYNRVERDFLEPVSFQSRGDINRAFLIHNVSEKEAEEIGNLFGATFILHFKMDPSLIIEIIPLPINEWDERELMFSFDN